MGWEVDMKRRPSIWAVMALLVLPCSAWAADSGQPPSDNKDTGQAAFADIQSRVSGEPVLVRYSAWNASFGWWAFWNTGSPAKTGEYQDLSPSPFWDIDGFSSNGFRTLAVTATGTDEETTKANVYFFQNNLTARVDYERYLHRRDHDPMNNIPDYTASPTNTTDPKIIKQDLNVGQDYAVRVQELNATIKLMANEDFKVRVDVWGMEKDGTRQANAVAMCYANSAGYGVPPASNPLNLQLPPDHLGKYAGNRCHVLSQVQQIDWLTQEIKPVVEMHLSDSLVLEYSRPMRAFSSDDGLATRFYDRTGKLSYSPTTNASPYAYGVVPDSYTEMDQLKLSGNLGEDTKVYAFMMAGTTVDREIDMSRWFNDVDVRVTNTSVRNTTITAYGSCFNEDEQMPNAAKVIAVNPENAPSTVAAQISAPIDYRRSTGGVKGVWRANGGGFDRGGLAIVGGYEYCDLERLNADYDLTKYIGGTSTTVVAFDQNRTITHGFQIGPDYRWSDTLDTYIRYKFQNAVQPLTGVQEPNGMTNTLLPQHDHIVEVGFNWVPADWFVANATIGVERGDNHSQYAQFDEENYPMSFSVWYAATKKLSVSAGYSVYSNFFAQDISVADQSTYAGNAANATKPVTGPWKYGAEAHVITLGADYMLSQRIRLTGQFEWVRGRNQVNSSTMFFPSTLVTTLGSYSDVINETTRLTMGVDYKLRPRVVTYARYELYNFNDVAPGYQTGLAQGILGGFSAMF
jgi:hypothetical protein